MSQGFSSEILPLQFPPCPQLNPKLASISSPILPRSKGDAGLGDPLLSQPWPPAQGWVAVCPRGRCPCRAAEAAARSPHNPLPAAAFSSFPEQKSKRGEQKLPSH